MAETAIRVLGIDTSLRSTGYAVIEARGSRLTMVEQGCLRMPDRLSVAECLVKLQAAMAEILGRTLPTEVAIEGIFFCKNVKTAVILGETRGAVIAACASRGLAIYEHAPRRVKQAVVGSGSADKSQVRKMVMSILGLREEPQEDAGDALAIAICHVHSRTAYAALAPKAM